MSSSTHLTPRFAPHTRRSIFKANASIDLRLIYPFKSRTFLKRVLDIVLLCNCLYLAMVVSNFGLVNIDVGWDALGGYTLGHIIVDVVMVRQRDGVSREAATNKIVFFDEERSDESMIMLLPPLRPPLRLAEEVILIALETTLQSMHAEHAFHLRRFATRALRNNRALTCHKDYLRHFSLS